MIYFSVFFSAVLSATLLPGSSEIVFYLALKKMANPWTIFSVAVLGNVLGSIFNYLLGRYLQHWLEKKIIGFHSEKMEKARKIFNRWGNWALFFSFLPVVGDPVTAIAGVAKFPFTRFVLWVFIGKAFRYLVLLGSILWLQQ